MGSASDGSKGRKKTAAIVSRKQILLFFPVRPLFDMKKRESAKHKV